MLVVDTLGLRAFPVAAAGASLLLALACSPSENGLTAPSSDLNTDRPSNSAQTSNARYVQFDFEASSFGGGPNRRGSSPGAPIRGVRGSFVVAFTEGGAATGVLRSFSVHPAATSTGTAWGATFDAQNMRLELVSPSGAPSQPRQTQLRVVSTTTSPYFSLSMGFDAGRQVSGSVPFGSASYRVAGDREIYSARSGSVTATPLSG